MAADTAKLPPFRPLPYKGPNIEAIRGEGGVVYLRSREPMAKWWLHLAQTFWFSSSSLSKIMVSHLGHLVHRPSGMSSFLRSERSRGLLKMPMGRNG